MIPIAVRPLISSQIMPAPIPLQVRDGERRHGATPVLFAQSPAGMRGGSAPTTAT